MLVTKLTEIVFIAIFAENQSTSWRESSFSTIFSIISLIIDHISDHLSWKLSNLLSKRGSQTSQTSQHCDSEKLEEKNTLRYTTVSEPQMKCKTFPLCSSAHIYNWKWEKPSAVLDQLMRGRNWDTECAGLSVRRGSVATWLCCFWGISAFIIPL